jgi:two-component system, response regulator
LRELGAHYHRRIIPISTSPNCNSFRNSISCAVLFCMQHREVEILLVEDNPDDEFLAMRAFRKHKVSNKIHVVRDGEEALDFIFCRGACANQNSCRNLKLVLLDLKLPKINGLEVLEAIKSNPQTCHIPVVLLTSSKEQEEMLRAYTSGANSFLHKPIHFEEFDALIKNVGFYWVNVNSSPNLLLVEAPAEENEEAVLA